jgi:hypothetical protein
MLHCARYSRRDAEILPLATFVGQDHGEPLRCFIFRHGGQLSDGRPLNHAEADG